MNIRITSLTFLAVPSRLVIKVAISVTSAPSPAPAPSNLMTLTTRSMAGITLFVKYSTNVVRIGNNNPPIVSCASVSRSRRIAILPANVSAATEA